MNSMTRLKSIFARFGTLTGATFLVSNALRRFCPFFSVEKYFVVAQPTAAQRLLPGKRGRSISVLVIDRHDHPLISTLLRPKAEMRRRFERGAICYLALRDAEVIGHLWVILTSYREPVHRAEFVPLPRGETAWDFDMWISPEERLGLAFARLWDECNRDLRQRGVTWTCSRVSAFNVESLNAHRRLGMRLLHTLFYLCAGSLEVLIADVAPYVNVSLRGSPMISVSVPGAGELQRAA